MLELGQVPCPRFYLYSTSREDRGSQAAPTNLKYMQEILTSEGTPADKSSSFDGEGINLCTHKERDERFIVLKTVVVFNHSESHTVAIPCQW